MKKFIIFILLFINIPSVSANEKINVSLEKCVDGDTAWFIKENEKIKTRFLAIDTPESTTKVEEYGKEASKYTCSMLTNANIIEIEYDSNSDKTDKYNRHLVWVFVDGELLQRKIIEEGLAEIAYLYGDYKYTDILNIAQSEAKNKQLGLWSNKTEANNNTVAYIFLCIIVLAIVCIFSKKTRTKVISKGKSKIKSKLKKAYKNL